MKKALLKFKRFIDGLNARVGAAVSWLSAVLVLLVCVNVVMRYVFNISLKWENELEWHVFAVFFLFAGGFTLLEDKHVRVDVFYAGFAPKDKALVQLIGGLLFLLPWTGLVIYFSFQYFWDSFLLSEGSPDPGGLTAWYWIKLAIPVGFFLLFLQGVSSVIGAYYSLWK